MPQPRRRCAGPIDVFRTVVPEAKIVVDDGIPRLSAAWTDKNVADLGLV
ncbi:MAG: hypothetical protein VX424_19130 [Actinomycetota bacterium]|nr:hypothetical protein [Actinomycetota bacterium]